jgi:hypothetical protein
VQTVRTEFVSEALIPAVDLVVVDNAPEVVQVFRTTTTISGNAAVSPLFSAGTPSFPDFRPGSGTGTE